MIPLIPLSEVPRHLPKRGKKRIHVSTVFRWAIHGVAGVKLRTVRMGRQKCTTEQWLMEFAEEIAQTEIAQTASTDEAQPPETKTEAILARHGLR